MHKVGCVPVWLCIGGAAGPLRGPAGRRGPCDWRELSPHALATRTQSASLEQPGRAGHKSRTAQKDRSPGPDAPRLAARRPQLTPMLKCNACWSGLEGKSVVTSCQHLYCEHAKHAVALRSSLASCSAN